MSKHTYYSCLFEIAINKNIPSQYHFIYFFFFFLSGFSITDTDDSQNSRGREGTIFYSTVPLPPAHEHSDIYLQLCMWDDYHIFLIATLVFTRLLLDDILPPYRITIYLIDWWCEVCFCLLDDLILGFCYSNFDTGNRWTRTITLVLQANRLTKCASHFI